MPPPPTDASHEVDAYARSVVDGVVPAGRYHRLACARHLRDRSRERTPGFPYVFDIERARRYFRFAEKLKHYKGEWAGQFIKLQPHQLFRKGCKYGWVHATTGLRRFRNSYEEIPRKNGKSLELSTETLYLTFFDGEAGAEGYCAATKREQALIIFNDCKKLIASSGLRSRLKVQVSNINDPRTSSKLEPLSSDYDTMDGLNVHTYTLDEMHALKNRGTVDVLETATGSRRQPLGNKITTAGDDPVSPCGDEHDYACKVLDQSVDDDTYFAFIAHADPEDDWMSPATAAKANPNYGISVKPEDLAGKVLKAMKMPSAAATYKQKHLNLWVNASQPCLSVDGWAAGQSKGWKPALEIPSLKHEPCYVGLDLASKIDLCAAAFVFPPTVGRPKWRWLLQIWTPEETLIERGRRDRAPYPVWAEQGWLLTNPGVRLDHRSVLECLVAASELYDIQAIGYDPWHADKLLDDIERALELNEDDAKRMITPISQTFAGMSSACLKVQADILSGEIDAGGCPVTGWSVGNVVPNTDGKANLMFAKGKSRGRIDPVIAATIATACFLKQPPVEDSEPFLEFVGGVRR